MIRCAKPRCCECAHPLHIVEPFVLAVSQQHRCEGCGVRLRVYRETVDTWAVATVTERAGDRPTPLPAVAPPELRHRFFTACRNVARLLTPSERVQPGMSEVGNG